MIVDGWLAVLTNALVGREGQINWQSIYTGGSDWVHKTVYLGGRKNKQTNTGVKPSNEGDQ